MKGQTAKELEKNYSRVIDILNKASNDEDKIEQLSTLQANKITNEHKAINRAFAAKAIYEEEYDVSDRINSDIDIKLSKNIFDIFLKRSYSLGSVGKQTYREYQLKKLGIFNDER